MFGGLNVIAVAGALVLSGALTAEVSARDLHVAPDAMARGADGSAERPWPGVSEALAAGAGPGDRLLLAPGDHGAVEIGGAGGVPPLVVEPADPALPPPRLSSLRVRGPGGVHVKGLLVEGGDGALELPLVRIDAAAAGVRLEGLTIRSTGNYADWSEEDWRTRARAGIQARGPGVEIAGNRLSAVKHGISVAGPGARVTGNDIDGFSGDAIRGLGDSALYENNRIANCFKVDATHVDGFQSWSRGPDGKPGTGTVRDVVLRGNTILNYTGRRGPFTCHLQGISLFDGMFENWLIEDNLVETDMWHGITVAGGVDVRVSGNTVRNIGTFPPGPPGIRVGAHKDGRPGGGNLIENNLSVGDVHFDPRVTVARDNRRLAPAVPR